MINALRKIAALAGFKTNTEPAIETPDNDATLHDAVLSGWFKHETGELFTGFKISSGDIVLDVGCGDAPFVAFCALQGAKVIFADIDREKISAGYKRLKNGPDMALYPIVSNVNPLPLNDGTASKIIAMEVLEHVEDPASFLSELVRVGRPGAQYLITVPDPSIEKIQQQLAPESYFQKPNHLRIFGRTDFEKHIVSAGLTIEDRAYYGFFWSIWWCFFWACEQDHGDPWHPILENWRKTWGLLLKTKQGPKIKQALDNFMPKSQAIIARKPQ
ncbi:MAG: class I SAM-dependent methyltransferase [Desulfobacteraceae bacterium]|nr:class I SAM-dependent methyltransferase [Desulfobacteraceae bacterium]